MSLFFRPDEKVAAADFIPFYWQGDYHLFYLLEDRTGTAPEGTPWMHLVTRDFVNFEDWGEAIPRGTQDTQDLYPFTGSVIERNGTFYIFYTGHNPHFSKVGRPREAIMRVTSSDLRTWTRDEQFLIMPPTAQGYEANDWRDPFVCWNPQAQQYWMLLAARRPNAGEPRRYGLTALMVSDDLERWELSEPLWAPDEYYTHECPDLFQIGSWWYLVFSTFSDRTATHYRMASSSRGPWLAPHDDAFDGRPHYAAKTASDGTRRYLFGWLADRKDDSDEGGWMWGGNLVVHEVVARPDGSLGARVPETVRNVFRTRVPLDPRPVLGPWQAQGDSLSVDSTSRFSEAKLGPMPDECLIETEVSFTSGTQSLGLLLRASEDLGKYYQVRLEPPRQRLVVDRYPRPGDQPLMLERPLALSAGTPVRLRVIADGTCLVVYANDTALSCRMYDHREGALGVFVTEGQADFKQMEMKQR